MLGKSKSSTIEVLISKALIGSNISHDEFVSLNDPLKKIQRNEKAIKNPKNINVVDRSLNFNEHKN